MRRFEQQVAFITGAAHGIGHATAARLSAEGAAIVVADIDVDAAQAAAAELPDALAVPCDVRDQKSVRAAVAAAVTRYGRLDVLVNNVGVAGMAPLEELDEAEWQRQVDPTLQGAIRCIQECLPHLLESPGGGAVVSISSVNGMTAIGDVAYSAAKAGLISMTGNLAVDYGRRVRQAEDSVCGWIRFNVVAPGTIRTRAWTEKGPAQLEQLERMKRLYPLARVGEPQDVAAAVAFLASEDASWITGVTLPVDGGLLTGPATFMYQMRQDL